LALSSASREISLSICEISLSIAATGCQLSLDNQRRQRGKEDRYSDLLIDPDGDASKKIDMVIAREQRNQGKQHAGYACINATSGARAAKAGQHVPLAHTRSGV
jgi:hypothetical protein